MKSLVVILRAILIHAMKILYTNIKQYKLYLFLDKDQILNVKVISKKFVLETY